MIGENRNFSSPVMCESRIAVAGEQKLLKKSSIFIRILEYRQASFIPLTESGCLQAL